jgi:hypothetical protein
MTGIRSLKIGHHVAFRAARVHQSTHALDVATCGQAQIGQFVRFNLKSKKEKTKGPAMSRAVGFARPWLPRGGPD